MDCKLYCMFVSATGAVFLVPLILPQMFLGLLVAFDSKTLYVIPKNRLASGVALIFSALVPQRITTDIRRNIRFHLLQQVHKCGATGAPQEGNGGTSSQTTRGKPINAGPQVNV